MGERARLTGWPVRAAFLGLIAVGAAVHGTALPVVRGYAVLDPARQVMERAGFRVTRIADKTSSGGDEGGHLVAQSAVCAQPLTIYAVPILERFADPGAQEIRPLYIFGGWQGYSPARPRLAAMSAWMNLHYALTLGRRGRPMPTMLKVSDPSACLAILTPDWASMWYG